MKKKNNNRLKKVLKLTIRKKGCKIMRRGAKEKTKIRQTIGAHAFRIDISTHATQTSRTSSSFSFWILLLLMTPLLWPLLLSRPQLLPLLSLVAVPKPRHRSVLYGLTRRPGLCCVTHKCSK